MKNVFVFAAALGAALGGCDLDDRDHGDVGSAQENLNGAALFPDYSCSSTQRNQIRRAMAIAANQILVNGDAFGTCLQKAVISDADGSFAETIVGQLAQNMPTTFFCGARSDVCGKDPSANANACASAHASYESMTFTDEFLSAQSGASTDGDRRVASVLLHELIHNKGLGHTPGYEYRYSPNEQVEWCSLTLSGYTLLSGLSHANDMEFRDTMQTEVELHPIGGDGGSPDDAVCAKGAFVSKLGVSLWPNASGLADWVRRVQVGCRQPAQTAVHTRRIGSGGTLQWDSCSASELAIGIEGRASDSRVSQLRLVCGATAALQSGGSPAPRRLTARGGFGGTSVERMCPAGTAVRAVLGRSGSDVDQLRVVCRRVSAPAAAHPYNLSSIASTSYGYGPKTTRHDCTDNGLMVGMYGLADVSLIRLGGICRGAEYTGRLRGAPWFRLRAAAKRHAFPANGGTGEADFQSEASGSLAGRLYCGGNQALVGIRSGSGVLGDIGHVQGVCADIDDWRTKSSFATSNLHTFGLVSSETTRTCPHGQFMVGLEVRSTVNIPIGRRTVQRIKPRCRAFGEPFGIPLKRR